LFLAFFMIGNVRIGVLPILKDMFVRTPCLLAPQLVSDTPLWMSQILKQASFQIRCLRLIASVQRKQQ
jgi:hypothetical protein